MECRVLKTYKPGNEIEEKADIKHLVLVDCNCLKGFEGKSVKGLEAA